MLIFWESAFSDASLDVLVGYPYWSPAASLATLATGDSRVYLLRTLAAVELEIILSAWGMPPSCAGDCGAVFRQL